MGYSIGGLINNIMTKPLKFDPDMKVSEESTDLLKKCLTIDEKQRIDWQDLYKHPLLKEQFVEFISQTERLQENMKFMVNELRQKIAREKIDLLDLFNEHNIKNEDYITFEK